MWPSCYGVNKFGNSRINFTYILYIRCNLDLYQSVHKLHDKNTVLYIHYWNKKKVMISFNSTKTSMMVVIYVRYRLLSCIFYICILFCSGIWTVQTCSLHFVLHTVYYFAKFECFVDQLYIRVLDDQKYRTIRHNNYNNNTNQNNINVSHYIIS